ncbi:BgTH12-04803 [Blumeria graminis f. sp. triticale]|uniref:BgTH12-04803 n=1 Tax=Blumeria graminis f. sp. triticale TaxID=1689686 RepID=A0A9W4DGM3_BLUGR|nr:BgTH12-04803 [Blumeria graminis f. sp. triticale]
MIRLDSQYEACKVEPFLLRQQVQQLIPDPWSFVDAWQVLSGIAILALTPAKASSILEHKDTIAAQFDSTTVKRWGIWIIFVVGLVPKKVNTLDGAVKSANGLVQLELAISAIKDAMPIRQLAWTKRPVESARLAWYIRIHVLEAKVHKFQSRMQLFGQATGAQYVQHRS